MQGYLGKWLPQKSWTNLWQRTWFGFSSGVLGTDLKWKNLWLLVGGRRYCTCREFYMLILSTRWHYLHGFCTCEVLYTLILSIHWHFPHVDVVYMGSAHEMGSSRWYCLHVEIIYTLTRLLHTNDVDTLIIIKTFKISLRYFGLHAAFTTLTSPHSPYTFSGY